MKKLLALALAASMTVSLASCGKTGGDSGSTGSASSTPPATGEFDWRAYEGTELNVLFSEHTYADAVKAKLNDFQDLTGIKVNLTTMPESNYYEKLNVELASKSGSIDVFMTGAYQAWEYATAGYMEPLEGYIENSSLTSADYDYDDFIDGVIDALKWDCVPGHAVGTGSQWALPMGWEINILTYNKQILADHNITPPKTAEELLAAATALKEFDGSGTYGLALRGTADWGTIHPAYMSMYTTWGAKDFEIEDGKLVSKVNSPEAIAMTEYWVNLVKNGSAPQWATYGWEMAGADLGCRQGRYDVGCRPRRLYPERGRCFRSVRQPGLRHRSLSHRCRQDRGRHEVQPVGLVHGYELRLSEQGSRLVLPAVLHQQGLHAVVRHRGRLHRYSS